LTLLNGRRRRAVELRIAGHSLPQIRLETGLSAPTIIAAFKAFLAGGWPAVSVKGRGRALGAGRALSAEQESVVREALLVGSPEAAGLDAGLWSTAAVAEFVTARFGIAIGTRTLARYLRRWGLEFESLRSAAASTAQGMQWIGEVLPVLVQHSRAQGAQVVWCDEVAVAHGKTAARVLMAQT